MKTLKINGNIYEYDVLLCADCDSFAVSLDLGNGKPELIGYVDSEAEAADRVREEIETLLAS